MSTRWSRRGEQTSQRRALREPVRQRYYTEHEERPSLSPIVIVILILAAITAMIICGLLMATSFKLIFPT